MPLIGNEWSKQTIYVGLLDAWYGSSADDKAYAIWIDDDSTIGVFKVKEIADKLGIEANMKNMGKLMKSTMAELKDKADGSAVNKAVKEFLSGK